METTENILSNSDEKKSDVSLRLLKAYYPCEGEKCFKIVVMCFTFDSA